jgi:hypothetical protein
MQIASDSDPDKYFEAFYHKNPLILVPVIKLILRGFVVYDKNKTARVADTSHADYTS